MKEKNNIQDINKELEGFPKLKSLKDKKPFSTPDSFFDNLEDDIMSKIAKESTPVRKIHMNTKQVLYYVAAASIIAIFIFIALRSGNQDANQTQIANQPTEINGEQNSIADTDNNQKDQQTDKKRLTEQIEKVNTIDKSTLTVEEKNAPINKVQNNKVDKDNINNQEKSIINETQSSNYDIANNDVDDFNKNSSLANHGSQAISNGSVDVSNSNYSPSTARKAVQNDLYLGDNRCSSKPVHLNALINDINNLKYRWSTDDTTAAIIVNKTGYYWVKIYDFKDNFLGSDSVNVKILNKPNPNLGPDKNICNYESVLISSGCNNTDFEYQWSVNDATTPEVYLSDLNPGIYTITLWVKSCADTSSSSMTITVNDCKLIIPNVITPNSDGQNDHFVIIGLENYPGSQLHILDRNGRIIFESTDYQNDWNANNIPTGTYFYRLQLNDGKRSEKNGTLSIIR